MDYVWSYKTRTVFSTSSTTGQTRQSLSSFVGCERDHSSTSQSDLPLLVLLERSHVSVLLEPKQGQGRVHFILPSYYMNQSINMDPTHLHSLQWSIWLSDWKYTLPLMDHFSSSSISLMDSRNSSTRWTSPPSTKENQMDPYQVNISWCTSTRQHSLSIIGSKVL